MREFGIGLQSSTRETPDVVGIEAWISGRSPTGPPPRGFGCTLLPDGHFRFGNSKSNLQNLGPMLNYISNDE